MTGSAGGCAASGRQIDERIGTSAVILDGVNRRRRRNRTQTLVHGASGRKELLGRHHGQILRLQRRRRRVDAVRIDGQIVFEIEAGAEQRAERLVG